MWTATRLSRALEDSFCCPECCDERAMLIFPISAKSLILQKHIERIKVTTMTMMDNTGPRWGQSPRAGAAQTANPFRWPPNGGEKSTLEMVGKKWLSGGSNSLRVEWEVLCISSGAARSWKYLSCGNYCFDFIRANRLYGCQL